MKNLIVFVGIRTLFLFPIFFLFSCSSPDQKSSGNEAKAAHSLDTVIIQQMQFIPSELKLNMGDTVIWINKDLVDHDVTSEKAGSFYSDTIAVGKTWKMVVKDSAAYHCSIHPSMKGQLLLK